MNISWVLADGIDLDPPQELEPLKQAGPFWGSWRTWRAYQTDNVICHDQARVDELLKRAFQAACNFYIPNSVYVALNQPLGVQVYQGDFVHEVEHQEEIVAMHLAASRSDIVLLLGFEWSQLSQQHYITAACSQVHGYNFVSMFHFMYKIALVNLHTQWLI